MKKNVIIFCSFLLVFTSCDKFLDIVPTGEVIPETTSEYRAVLTRAYEATPSMRGLASFRSDEFDITTSVNRDPYKDIWIWNDINPSDNTVTFLWRQYYFNIFLSNEIIENEGIMRDGTESDIKQLVGEAFMFRAYMHFVLVNLYAKTYGGTSTTDKGVPIKLNTDIEEVPSRNTVAEVYAAVLNDINEAEKRLQVAKWELGKNYRFNTLSVNALRSRVYLYMSDWENSLKYSTNLLQSNSTLTDLNIASQLSPNHFTSPESIVALENVISSDYAGTGSVSRALLALYKTGDLRKNKYYNAVTTSIYSIVKYGSAYRCSFRVGEVYLNAAEAACQLDRLDEAREYLFALLEKRYRAANYAGIKAEIEGLGQEDLLNYIYDERFKELAFEGHRWFDLRRTTQPRLEKTIGGVTYVLEDHDERYTIKIPTDAVKANPNLAN